MLLRCRQITCHVTSTRIVTTGRIFCIILGALYSVIALGYTGGYLFLQFSRNNLDGICFTFSILVFRHPNTYENSGVGLIRCTRLLGQCVCISWCSKPVQTVVMSRDGFYVACGAGTSIYLFDVSFSEETYLWSYDTEAGVTSLSTSGSGQLMVVGDEKGFLHVLENLYTSPRLITTTELTASTHLITTAETTTSTGGAVTGALLINLYAVPITLSIAVLTFLGLYMQKGRARKRREIGKPRAASLTEPKKALPIASGRIISTGMKVLDELTLGGFPQSYSVILSSPSCNQRDLVVQGFLGESVDDEKFVLCLTTDTEGGSPS